MKIKLPIPIEPIITITAIIIIILWAVYTYM